MDWRLTHQASLVSPRLFILGVLRLKMQPFTSSTATTAVWPPTIWAQPSPTRPTSSPRVCHSPYCMPCTDYFISIRLCINNAVTMPAIRADNQDIIQNTKTALQNITQFHKPDSQKLWCGKVTCYVKTSYITIVAFIFRHFELHQ